jgi:hypothetical protein
MIIINAAMGGFSKQNKKTTAVSQWFEDRTSDAKVG